MLILVTVENEMQYRLHCTDFLVVHGEFCDGSVQVARPGKFLLRAPHPRAGMLDLQATNYKI